MDSRPHEDALHLEGGLGFNVGFIGDLVFIIIIRAKLSTARLTKIKSEELVDWRNQGCRFQEGEGNDFGSSVGVKWKVKRSNRSVSLFDIVYPNFYLFSPKNHLISLNKLKIFGEKTILKGGWEII